MISSSSFNFLFKFYLLIFLCLLPESGQAQEICNNGIDDDNNGLIDLNDPGCACEIVDYQSMIPNPSFEDYSCCPKGPGQMTCLNDWSQASAGTIDYLNLCANWSTESFYAPPFPLPDGNACLRLLDGYLKGETETYIHKEYAGVCLNVPMKKDSLYIFELHLGFRDEINSPDFEISFFGTNDCTNLPFSIGEEFDCPLRYTGFTLLNSKLIPNDPGNLWKKISIEIRPEEDIYAIAVGPDCVSDGPKESFVYYLDNFLLNKESDLDFQLSELKASCASDFSFAVEYQPSFSYQWYKEGIALVGETASMLSMMHGEGRYQLRIIDGTQCRISEDYIYAIPVYTEQISQTICKEEEFLFGDTWLSKSGIYVDTFRSVDHCDSIVTLNLEVRPNSIDSLQRHILDGSTFEFNEVSYFSEGIYPTYLKTIDGCDSIIVLQLSLSNIYIPNAFSPNGDGINDIFQIYGGEEEIAKAIISIYDRWGGLVFVGEEWDGMVGNESLNPGIYVYSVELTTLLNDKLRYFGDLTLRR